MLDQNLKPLRRKRRSESGMAIFEVIPVLVIFALFCSYTYGFFSAIHSGIIHSIAARNYAFETFRHRNNLTYFRSTRGPDTDKVSYANPGVRYHGVIKHDPPGARFYAPTHSIAYTSEYDIQVNNSSAAEEYHNTEIVRQTRPGQRFNSSEGVNPIWLRIQYGICINVTCGIDR